MRFDRPWRPGLALFALAVTVAHISLSAPLEPAQDPRVSSRTTAGDLAALLRAARSGEEATALVRAFADAHRPSRDAARYWTEDGSLVVVVGANGTATHRDGFDAAVPSIPSGCAQLILVAGNGRSGGAAAAGGDGGACRVGAEVAGAGGDGGPGLIGGSGGAGGWSRSTLGGLLGASANGGAGGAGLVGLGSGGAGGDARGGAPSEPAVFALCGRGGRGLVGGDGGGR